jgi:hypothetical protein
MIRAVGYLAAELFWTVVHRVFDPYATRDREDDDQTSPLNIQRWVGGHQQPPPRGGD